MADRREQILAAMGEKDEEETGEEPGTETVTPNGDEEPVLEPSKEAPQEEKSGTGKEAVQEGGKKLDKSARAEVPGSNKKLVGADGKPLSAKAPAKDDAAKATEAAERAAAEAGEAPRAWKPATREHWAKLPKEVREQVNSRESEITQFIGQHGAAIQHKRQFDDIVQPFMPFIAAQQSTPMKAFHGLMTTAARLTTGAPAAKAAVIAEIMDNYGVDVKTLDEVLSAKLQGRGPLPQQQQQSAGPPEWAKPLFNFMSEATTARQTREQRVQQEAAAELAKFETKPFFSDLREDIGLLMQRAAQKGELLTMEQAYDKARRMNSEVDKILTQREKAAAGNGKDLERARRAASSINGAPSGAGGAAPAKKNGSGEKMDRRGAISAAFDSLIED